MLHKLRYIKLTVARYWLHLRQLISARKYRLLHQITGGKYPRIRVEAKLSKVSTNRVAIIACFPQPGALYLKSLGNLLIGLHKNSITPFIVFNSDSHLQIPQDLESFLHNNKTDYIVRSNYGRDFGAYQSGIQFLQKSNLYKEINRLILVNDTLIWPNSSNEIIQNTTKLDFQSIWLNLEQNVHAHSFYISLSGRVLSDNNFLQFWKKYLPLDSRNHAIHAGENALTNTLLTSGFTCHPYVTHDYIIAACNELLLNNPTNFELLRHSRVSKLLPGHPPFAFDEIENLFNAKVLSAAELIEIFGSLVHSDAPHRMGLLNIILADLPIKQDLFKYYGLHELKNVLRAKFESDFADQIIEYFMARSQRYQKSDTKTVKLRKLGEL